MKKTNITIDEILTACPGPVISRQHAAQISGGLLSAKTLANFDSLGIGPAKRVKIGTRAGYTSESFAHWLFNKIVKHEGKRHEKNK